jgi:hypothetical protein
MYGSSLNFLTGGISDCNTSEHGILRSVNASAVRPRNRIGSSNPGAAFFQSSVTASLIVIASPQKYLGNNVEACYLA